MADKSPGQQISTALPPDVAAALTALNSGGIFIGVPKGSQTEANLSRLGNVAQGAATGRSFGVRSPFTRTTTGFEAYKTGTELDQLAGFGPDEIAALQHRLFDAGMIDSFLPGQLDKTTRNAFKELLAESNAAGRKWTDTLDMISAFPKVGKGTAKPPKTIELTNPEDIRALLHATALSLYGGDLDPAQTEAFVSHFQSQELAAGEQKYKAQYGTAGVGDTGAGGVITAAPTELGLKAQAEQAIRQAHPDQVFVSALGKALKDTLPGLVQPGGGAFG